MQKNKNVVFSWDSNKGLGKKIAKGLGIGYSGLIVKKFPDGETYLRFGVGVKGKNVILVQSLINDQNNKIMEVIFAAKTAKELGAKKVVLVAPYMAYMRQDKRFKGGGCVSSKIVSMLLKGVVDGLYTVDPHLHRYKNMKELFRFPSKRISSVGLIAEYMKKHFKDFIVVGPDKESFQWARVVAKLCDVEAVVLKKKRYCSRDVRINVNVGFGVKNVVIVDDIISTGHTMLEVVKGVRKKGVKNVYCVGVHGIFAENADKKLKKSGAKEIITTNTIENKTSRIDVSELIIRELKGV